ncbi:SOS response-associated peptidase [Amedibacillus sp. YH-ame10]
MCGRYFFMLEDNPAFQKLRHKIDQLALFEYAQEEVFPSNDALVLLSATKDYTLDVMKWGLQGYTSNLLINARSESIEDKKTFQTMLHNRCLIPCNGFFEWKRVGKRKQKVYIRRDDTPLFYLAGIYNEQKEFVIVTGESEADMLNLHNRTPIILTEEQIPLYLEEQLPFQVDNEHLSFHKEVINDAYEQLDLFKEKEEVE